jgi:hypothetical protein
MDVEFYKTLYLTSGFFWNNNLSEFVSEFAGKETTYPHHKTRISQIARFCLPDLIKVGRSYGQHELTVKYLGEEIAPVGDCNCMHIELLISETGRLIGFADYLLLRWGNDGVDWRSSMKSLLDGSEAFEIGVIPTK